VNLNNGDIVIIPPYSARVKIKGEDDKETLFEMKNNKSNLREFLNFFDDLLPKMSVKKYKYLES